MKFPEHCWNNCGFILSAEIFIHAFIHSLILNIYIAPPQENYSEVIPTPARLMIDEIKTKLVLVLNVKGLCTHCRLNVCVSSKKSLFPVGLGGPLDDSSRAGCGPRAGRCAPLA